MQSEEFQVPLWELWVHSLEMDQPVYSALTGAFWALGEELFESSLKVTALELLKKEKSQLHNEGPSRQTQMWALWICRAGPLSLESLYAFPLNNRSYIVKSHIFLLWTWLGSCPLGCAEKGHARPAAFISAVIQILNECPLFTADLTGTNTDCNLFRGFGCFHLQNLVSEFGCLRNPSLPILEALWAKS